MIKLLSPLKRAFAHCGVQVSVVSTYSKLIRHDVKGHPVPTSLLAWLRESADMRVWPLRAGGFTPRIMQQQEGVSGQAVQLLRANGQT